MHTRLTELRRELIRRDLDALWVSGRENQEYLTGFTAFRDSSRTVNCLGDLLVTESRAFIFPSRCEVSQLRDHTPSGFTLVPPDTLVMSDLVRSLNIRRAGMEAEHLSLCRFEELERVLHFLQLVPVTGIIEALRQVKDADELNLIRHAVRIADQTMAEALAFARPGVAERELAVVVECSLRKSGAMKTAFDPIVSSGPRSAYIHPAAGDRRLRAGELLIIDFGAGYEHYYSDLTRTVVMGTPTAEQATRYNVIGEALRRTTDAVRPGIHASELDAIARRVICEAGLGEFLVHSVGHGVGRSVHELPWLRAGNDAVLEADMVIALEPGVYIPGWGGMRLENIVRVTPDGHEVLTQSPLSLQIW